MWRKIDLLSSKGAVKREPKDVGKHCTALSVFFPEPEGSSERQCF